MGKILKEDFYFYLKAKNETLQITFLVVYGHKLPHEL